VLLIKRTDSSGPEWRIATGDNGIAKATLSPGNYVARSEDPLIFEDRSYTWERTFTVSPGNAPALDLGSDTAKSAQKRRVSEAAELFKTLRDGVVTVEGDLATGSGFIFDPKGLVLTNHHVVIETNEIRVRFDRNTAVKARLIAFDEEKDLAVLQVNLSAFPAGKPLKLAQTTSTEPTVVEGENVFSIGSPAQQEKLLTTGVVSKVEVRAIISDINFSAGSSGGPLFNSLGEVVGVTTFKVSDKEASGLAGVVRIEEAQALIANAREIASQKGLPSAELMPNVPEGTFPVETIKTAVTSPNFTSKAYISDVKDYQVRYMTPVYKFYMIEKDRIESLKDRGKRNKDKDGVNAADMFRDLRVWKEYAGELRPLVDILALPETTPTGKSMFLSAATAMTVGISTPLDNKYKADFSQMKLLCDGREVTPIRRSKTEIARDMQSYYKTKKRFTYAGVYSYPYDVFAPGRCSQMEVHVFSEEDIEKPIVSTVTDAIKARIWNDFADFRAQVTPAM
jgi:S1-C subfamily serine protease